MHIPLILLEEYSHHSEGSPEAVQNDIRIHLEHCDSCMETLQLFQTAARLDAEKSESAKCQTATHAVLDSRWMRDSASASVIHLVPDMQKHARSAAPPSAVALAAQSSVSPAHFVLMNSLSSSDGEIRMNILRRIATGELLAQVLSEDGRFVEHVIVTFPAHEAASITNAIGEFVLPRSASLLAIDHGAMVHCPVFRASLTELGFPVPVDLLEDGTSMSIDERVFMISKDSRAQEPVLRLQPIEDPDHERICFLAVLRNDLAVIAREDENGFVILLSDLTDDAELLLYE